MIRISCKEVSSAVARSDYSSAPALTRLRIGLHLLICRYCRRFKRQMELIAAALREDVFPVPESESVRTLERAALERLRAL